jgi:uncharacterized membrane protein YfcA
VRDPAILHVILAFGSGALVSFLLGLFGGGGSMLALPLLLHVVGVPSPHAAIGVSAAAVSANALTNLGLHARHQMVKWRCAALFTVSGIAGAAAGAALGKSMNGHGLLVFFGIFTVAVGALMLRRPRSPGQPEVRLTLLSAPILAPRLVALGFAIGATSGFFGIGGGFLIAPALVWATDMPLAMAIGSSLVAVAAFGATTAISYGASGMIDWPLTTLFALGGLLGGLAGSRLTARLASRAQALRPAFAAFVIASGIYVTADGAAKFLT